MSPSSDPRLQLHIPNGRTQLFFGWVLLVLGVFVSFASGAAGGAMIAFGGSLIAWGTGSRWLHHIEAKQHLLMQWHLEMLERQAPPPVPAAEFTVVDASKHS